MLSPRIIPCLLIQNRGLVKTVNFKNPKYVGDPVNAVKIFNEKQVDELIVLDIDASANNREPDYEMIEGIAAECRMPLCYGGGVDSVEKVVKIINLGVEKVALSSAVLDNKNLISEASRVVGSQSIVVVLDVRRIGREYKIFKFNGQVECNKSPFEFASQLAELGAGEIVINSIDTDGVMKGYDFELVRRMKEKLGIPLTVLGGAGSLDDIGKLFAEFGLLGAAAGSLFVFKGKFKAVLINYPSTDLKISLFNQK